MPTLKPYAAAPMIAGLVVAVTIIRHTFGQGVGDIALAIAIGACSLFVMKRSHSWRYSLGVAAAMYLIFLATLFFGGDDPRQIHPVLVCALGLGVLAWTAVIVRLWWLQRSTERVNEVAT